MPISDEQRERRKGYIGASEVHSILNGTGYDVWARRQDDYVPEETAGTPAEVGNYHESGIIQWYTDTHGLSGKRLDSPDKQAEFSHGVLVAHPDAVFTNHLMEAKASALRGEYGKEGSDEIPDKVWAQCQAQMHAAFKSDLGLWDNWVLYAERRVHIVLLTGYPVLAHLEFYCDYDQNWCETVMMPALEQWWQMHMVGGVIPEPGESTPTAEYYEKTRPRIAGPIMDADERIHELIDRRHQVDAILKPAQKERKDIDLNLKAALGDYEICATPIGNLTYRGRETETLVREGGEDACARCGVGVRRKLVRRLSVP